MKLFIEPVDVWLFRDGRPFNAGTDHRARSLFPPYPSVMQGVVRSHQLVVQGIDLADGDAIRDAVGTATDYRGLRVCGPFVARREDGCVTRYVPAPWGGILREDEKLHPLTPRAVPEGVQISAPTARLLWHDGDRKKPKGRMWLSEDALLRYLEGHPVEPVLQTELFCREDRLGIGLDDATRTTAESQEGAGLLYETEFIRTREKVGLEIDVRGLAGLDQWPDRGVLRIGGGGRGGRYEPSNSPPWPGVPDPLPGRFQVFFATPTCFDAGWQPETWERFFDGNARLVAAAIGRYESIGGFDVAAGRQKPARRYVPAGSVYFFESENGTRLNPDLINAAITDAGAEIGFGQVIIRRWSDV